jgi:hypothetical protein
MTAVDMQRLMGKAQGALFADHPLATGPSLTEFLPTSRLTTPSALSGSTSPQSQPDAGLGGAFSAIGQKANEITQAMQNA